MTYTMTIEQIKPLLSRFYEGQTTPDEERLLADFFRREDVPEELQEDKQLFLTLAKISDQEMPQDIAEDITAFVNNLGQTEKKPVLSEDKQHKEIIFRLKTPPKMWYRVAATVDSWSAVVHARKKLRIASVAATVAILLAIGGGFGWYQSVKDPFRDTCATAEEAAQEILYANAIINRSFAPFFQSTATATEQVNEMNKTIQKATQYINY